MIFEARRLNRAPLSAENQIQGENLPLPETDGGGFLPEFDFPQNLKKMLQSSGGALPSASWLLRCVRRKDLIFDGLISRSNMLPYGRVLADLHIPQN